MLKKNNVIRKKLHLKSFTYDVNKYPFKKEIENIFGCKTEELHLYLGSFQEFKRERDQSTLAHKVFYSNYKLRISSLYESFQHEIIRPILGVDFYYQVIPTFRIGLPGNMFVGEYHRDSDYNHQDYEVNFNLCIYGYLSVSSLNVEKEHGSNEFVKIECPYGRIFSFDHITYLHGSDINKSNETLVSFDFRVALRSLYFDSSATSINMRSKFKPGSYFSSEIV